MSSEVMERTEADLGTVYQLDLDLDVINHLALPASLARIQAEQLKVDLFRDELTQKVFRWQMQHVRDYGEPASPSVLEDQFPDIELETPDTNINDLIERLRKRYIRNEGKIAIQELTQLAIGEPLSVAREMARASRRLLDLTVTRGEIYGQGDVNRAIAEYHKQKARGKGPSLGYEELDEHFYGQMGVTFLIGAPKSCKSWFIINMFLENILQEKKPYLFPLELPALETYWRMACMSANVPYWKYLKRRLMKDELALVEERARELDELTPYHIDKPNQGERSVAQLVTKAQDAGADCIIIDQLQYVENRKGAAIGALNSTADYFEVVNDLRNLSDEIPIVVVHQFNRSIMKAGEMPEMQQAKGSSAVEEVATLALGLWADRDMRKEGLVELGTLASRNYDHASWQLGISLSRECDIKMLGPILED